MADLEWLTYDDFAGRVGESFEVALGDAVLPLELIEATVSPEAGGRGPGGEERQQFSLLFRGPLDTALPQGSHRLRPSGGADLELFLVPLGPDGFGMRYEAAFA
jgi:hypothetical protein